MKVGDFPLMRWVVAYGNKVEHNLGSSNVPGLKLDLSPYSPFDLHLSSNKGQQETLDAILRLYPGGLDAMTANGASEANFLSLYTLLDADSVVAVEAPTYDPLRLTPESMGCRIVDIERRFAEGWSIDAERLKAAAPELDLLVLTNAHNPTGTTLRDADRRLVLDLARDHGFTVLCDEIFRMLVPDKVRTLAGEENVVVTCSLTKSAGISGARCGWVVGDKAAIERILATKRMTSAATSPIGEAILRDTLARYPACVAATVATLARRMETLARFIEGREEMSWHRPIGGVAFPRLEIPIPTLEFCEGLLERRGVLVIPGEFFNRPGFVRMGVGMAEPDEALRRMGEELDSLRR